MALQISNDDPYDDRDIGDDKDIGNDRDIGDDKDIGELDIEADEVEIDQIGGDPLDIPPRVARKDVQATKLVKVIGVDVYRSFGEYLRDKGEKGWRQYYSHAERYVRALDATNPGLMDKLLDALESGWPVLSDYTTAEARERLVVDAIGRIGLHAVVENVEPKAPKLDQGKNAMRLNPADMEYGVASLRPTDLWCSMASHGKTEVLDERIRDVAPALALVGTGSARDQAVQSLNDLKDLAFKLDDTRALMTWNVFAFRSPEQWIRTRSKWQHLGQVKDRSRFVSLEAPVGAHTELTLNEVLDPNEEDEEQKLMNVLDELVVEDNPMSEPECNFDAADILDQLESREELLVFMVKNSIDDGGFKVDGDTKSKKRMDVWDQVAAEVNHTLSLSHELSGKDCIKLYTKARNDLQLAFSREILYAAENKAAEMSQAPHSGHTRREDVLSETISEIMGVYGANLQMETLVRCVIQTARKNADEFPAMNAIYKGIHGMTGFEAVVMDETRKAENAIRQRSMA